MNWKRFVCLTLLLLLAVLLSAGCLTATGRKGTEKTIRYSAGAEPQTLDPRKSTGSVESAVEAQLFEGLTALDNNGQPVPAVAERWNISSDGLQYTFYLKSNARWSNGDAVTAHDFAYAWMTALSPELASEYAYQLYYIKNGEAFSKGEAGPDALGIRVLDDRTLEVTLEYPTAYFLSLLSFHTYYPVHKTTVAANPKWAAEPHTLISNGPFKITGWIHNSHISFSKNEFYWDAAKVKLSKLEFILTESSATEMAMFDNNQIDIGDNPPTHELPRLRRENQLTITPYLGTYYYSFNVSQAPFDNSNVRKAFSLAIDREAIIKNITKGEQQVAQAWIPYGLSDAVPGQDFRQVGGNYIPNLDVDEAKRLLAQAGYPDGKGFPQVTLIYNTSEAHKAIAEAVQEMWRNHLGVTVNLANQEWKVFLDNRHKGFYQVARHGWVGDYADPMTFLDMFTSDSGNNNSQYRNPAYDRLIRTAKAELDQQARMKVMHDAETMLFDDSVLAPLYYYTKIMMVKPNIKGYTRSVLGTLYFKEAYIE